MINNQSTQSSTITSTTTNMNQLRKLSLILSIWIMVSWMSSMEPLMANPVSGSVNIENGGGGGNDVVVPLDSTTFKSILLYNRLNQLVQNEPEVLDLFDMDRQQISRVIDELLSQSNQIRTRKFLNARSSKRAAAMGVDLPDYILHINKGRNFDFSSFREKMQKSG